MTIKAAVPAALRACLPLTPLLCLAQAPTVPAPKPPPSCSSQEAKENAQWAKSSHSYLSNVFHSERVGIKYSYCRIHETSGADRLHKLEDFGRNLFTGEGLHPVVGGIVPGSGLAAGAVLNLKGAAATRPRRFDAKTEARGSINGFWVADARLEITGSAKTDENEHIHATFAFSHYSLPQLAYYGLGNASALANKTRYSLQENRVGAAVDVPLSHGFTATGVAEGLSFTPTGSHGSGTPSIETKFTPSDTPGLNAGTAYVVAGGGLRWKYPTSERLRGHRTEAAVQARVFHAASGGAYSFRRFDAGWAQHYTPDTAFNFGTLSLLSRLTVTGTPRGNAVPFYLQPTLGGTDIEKQTGLRSYRDYRFRAPNLVSFQAEYNRVLWGPLGGLLFYDVGKVAMTRGNLSLNHLHHSYGVGVTLALGNFHYVRLSFAWGGGEGTHTALTSNLTRPVAEPLKGVF